jgi:Ca2+-binding EF-hand superfamily protein
MRNELMAKLFKAAVLGVLVIGLGVSPALAGAGKRAKKSPEQRFQKLDTNKDGGLSLEEIKGKGKKDPAKVEKRFKKLDRNGDGKVTLAELQGRGKKKGKTT